MIQVLSTPGDLLYRLFIQELGGIVYSPDQSSTQALYSGRMKGFHGKLAHASIAPPRTTATISIGSIRDFSDVIAELDDRKRQLMQRARDEFFEFMGERFMPDLVIRLSDDIDHPGNAAQGQMQSRRPSRPGGAGTA